MKLPKWVVKGVKDNFNVEALELKCKQNEEENRRLKMKIAELRYYDLPKEEIECVERACAIMWLSLFWWDRSKFYEEYMRARDEDEKRKFNADFDKWISNIHK